VKGNIQDRKKRKESRTAGTGRDLEREDIKENREEKWRT
jgi:hypothetical protein